MRILIAEDDPISAHVLEATLRGNGHEVVVASDGLQAWKVLQSEERPHIAILDWMMPGMDGLEVCRKVRQQGGAYVYILLLTANTQPADVVIGMDAGADDYIKKPFDPAELQARLRSGKRIVELEEKLRLQATLDPLTGLANRRAILERISTELERAHRDGTFTTLGIIDLDHFKQVNDSLGHAAGDAVLRETAARMKAVMRPYDSIGRYGGEEFIVVFPRCEMTDAAAIAERLRAAISKMPVLTGRGRIKVTASVGLADVKGSRDADGLIAAADAALFHAKNAGRNRVELASGKRALGARSRMS